MFSLYNRRSRVVVKSGGGGGWPADDDDQHDRFNRRCPSKNYDKFPKRIRPRKPQGCEVEEAEAEAAAMTLGSTGAAEDGLNGLANGNNASTTGALSSLGCLGNVSKRFSCSFPFLPQQQPPQQQPLHPRASIYELPSTRPLPSAIPRRRRLSSVTREMDSLANWLNRLRWKNGRATRRRSTHIANHRHYTRYDYTALEDEQSLQEKMEMERKVLRSQARETAFLTCQYYLKNSGRYVLLEQLGDIGSRLDKFWFLVRDASTKTERLLTMIPQTVNSPINFSATTKKVLAELFLALQHPYIYPVLDVDVKMLAEEEYVMVILPYNAKGSLKDIIYKARCQEDWQDKYHHRSNGLPIGQVQRLGRHILEALLFLQERGFPTFGHLHSGNIIVQNGVSRLTGFENTLLGYTSRIYSLIKRKVKDDREAIDVICFGHVLFEMCAGYELSTPHPTSRHIEELQQVPQYSQIVEVLNFIFDQDDGHYPTIEQVSLIDFFRNMDLREMRSMPVPPVFQSQLSPAVCNLLKDVSRHQKTRRCGKLKKRRSNSTSNPADDPEGLTVSLLSRQSSESSHHMTSANAPTSYPYTEMPSHNAFERGCVNEEFHTPPNTPMTSKSLLDDPAPFVAILTPSSSSHKLPGQSAVLPENQNSSPSRSRLQRSDPKVELHVLPKV